LKKRGSLILNNKFRLPFDNGNRNDIKNLFAFSLIYGVEFSNKVGYWHYVDNILETPTGIKFNVKNFNPLIFAETFLYDIHFSDFDLTNKTVIQAGGFIGDTALYFASRGAIVYSFEPDISSFNLAVNNIKINPHLAKNIVIRNCAIGKDEEIDFPVDPYGTGGSSAFELTGKNTTKIISVSISKILTEFSIEKPFLLDLDIKGKEFEVIDDKNISKFEKVRIEYSTRIGDRIIGNRDDIIIKLRNLGFDRIRIYKHNEGTFDLTHHGTIEAAK
jgi:FkbM family methyltransferase